MVDLQYYKNMNNDIYLMIKTQINDLNDKFLFENNIIPNRILDILKKLNTYNDIIIYSEFFADYDINNIEDLFEIEDNINKELERYIVISNSDLIHIYVNYDEFNFNEFIGMFYKLKDIINCSANYDDVLSTEITYNLDDFTVKYSLYVLKDECEDKIKTINDFLSFENVKNKIIKKADV